MVKFGVSNENTRGTQDVVYMGEKEGYVPQMELAQYLSLLGLQKKMQADERYGGTGNAKKFGFGLFGRNWLEGAAGPGKPPEPQKMPAPTPDGGGTVVTVPPGGGTPAPPPGGTPAPPPGGTPQPPPGGGGAPGVGDPPPADGPKEPIRQPVYQDPYMTTTARQRQQPSPDELLAAWRNSRGA